MSRAVIILVLLALSLAARAALPPQLAFEVANPIYPARVDGQALLAWELRVDNYTATPTELESLDVIAKDGSLLGHYTGKELTDRLSSGSATLSGGAFETAFLWLQPATLPTSLHHRLVVKRGEGPSESLDGPAVPVSGQAPMVLRAPFDEPGPWLAANGPSNASHHRRALLCVDGQPWISQRFAIDWILLWPDGEHLHGDKALNTSYACFGKHAVAVAEGTVVALKDGVPLNTPGLTSRAVTIDLDTVGGNTVGLDLGQGRYAMYAHLQPGSLQVKLGDHVHAGQVLGLIGNTGNSTEPHLHFHLATQPNWVKADGLPYLLEHFTVQDVDVPGHRLLPGRAALSSIERLGHKRGLAEGRVQANRDAILRVFRARWGEPGSQVGDYLNGLADEAMLTALLEAAALACTREEFVGSLEQGQSSTSASG